MSFTTYEQLEEAMREYFCTGNKQLLADIQQVGSKEGYAHMKIREKLKLYPEYICFVDEENQVEIIQDMVRKAAKKQKKYYSVCDMLLEVSDEVRAEVLRYLNKDAILSVLEYIQKNIRKIGQRHYDTFHKPGCDNTSFLSRRREVEEWKQLYKFCETVMMSK